MKKYLLCVFALLLVSNTVFSSYTKEENAIRAVHLSVQAWSSNSSATIPMEKIYDKNNSLIGQYFYAIANFSLFKVGLVKNNQTIDSIYIENHYRTHVELDWEGDRVSNIRIPVRMNFNYKIIYDDNDRIIGFRCNELIQNGKKAIYVVVEYENDRISAIKRIIHKASASYAKGLISSFNSYTYADNLINIHHVDYYKNKPNKPKNIRVQDSVKFIYDLDKKIFTYNGLKLFTKKIFGENNKISYEERSESGFSKVSTYEYYENEVFKETTTSKRNGNFSEKSIRINIDRPDLPDSLPDYERVEGIYSFDVNDELVKVIQNGKYKDRINGVWSDWKFMRY